VKTYLEHKPPPYPTYAIFYSDGRKTIHYSPKSDEELVAFNNDVKLTPEGNDGVCFDRLPVKVKDAAFNTNTFSNICFGTDQIGTVIRAMMIFGTAVLIEPLAVSETQAGWIVGLLPGPRRIK
jgi:hypothetical protein